jgi:hypothetical protein
MSDFLALDTLVLDPRFNGGYACGAIGELVDGPAEVTLHTPPPFGVPLDLKFLPGGEIEVHHGDTLVMSARPVDGVDVEPPVRPTLAEAREATHRHRGVTASVFLPDATVPNRGGVVAPGIVWAALDDPSATSPSLLARLAVERLDVVEVGEPVIATGWHVASEGRTHHTASALLSVEGDVLARARALWITPRSPR